MTNMDALANDGRGVKALGMAMEMSDALTVQCCPMLTHYIIQVGDINRAQTCRRKILIHQVET